MSVFVTNNTFISRNDSVITGSLNVELISSSHNGTASYVSTASYVFASETASYTLATFINSSSYATNSVTASIALTASSVTGLYHAPNPSIGYLSPNVHIGAPASTASVVTSTTYNGIMLTPILINRPCTLTTMSITGGAFGAVTASFGIYSNSSTTNLPEYLLASGSLRTGTVVAPTVFHVSNFSPITLNANTVYWVAFMPTATTVGGVTNWRYFYTTNQLDYLSFNPLLYARLSTTTSSISNYPAWAIRSGSNPTSAGPFLPATASQNTGSYTLPAAAGTGGTAVGGGNVCILPVLKVTY